MNAAELAEVDRLYHAVALALTHLGTASAALDDLAAGPLAEMVMAHDVARDHLTTAWDALTWVRERLEGRT